VRRVFVSSLGRVVLAVSALTGAVLLTGCSALAQDADGSVPYITPTPVTADLLERQDLLLPDLQIAVPEELFIQPGANGEREIRFSSHIENRGEGPLSIIGSVDLESGEIATVQVISTRDGGTVEHKTGRFVFDDGHDHWHLLDFMVFELWSIHPDGTLRERIASTGKMTFCLVDSYPIGGAPPQTPSEFLSCGDEIQGISSGWVDVYNSALPGQQLPITGLPDGRYAIRSVVDPDGLIIESDEDNNDSVAFVDIAGMTIAIVG
jgi:hypothetical protein